jgi:Na+/proline symporter
MIDWGIIAAYVALALAVGVWFSKRASSSTSEYFLSGRTLPWWVLGTSMAATTFAADTPLAITELVRTEGIWRNWFWWNVALQGLLATFLFAPLWRRARVVTDQELIELRYSGRRAAFLRAFKALYFAVIQNCLVMSWVIAGMSTVLSVLLDVPQTIAVTGCLAVALVYSILSGFWGVVATDLVQYLVAVAGATILAVIAVSHVGGMDALTEALARSETSPAHLMDFFPPLTAEGTSWLDAPFFKVAVYLTVVWWASQNVEGGGYIVQRMSAARDERHALLGTLWFNLCNFAVRSWPWITVALVSLVLFPDLSDHPLGEKAGYPLVIDAVLGPGLRGLLVVSFLAAFMSTIDTHLNWGASYLINDVYRRFIRPEAGERHCVIVSKLCVVALVVLAGVGSLFVGSISGLWELVWALGCGLGPVLVLRWFWWRVSAVSEIAALAASLGATGLIQVLAWLWPQASLLGFALGSLPIHIKILLVAPFSILCWTVATFLTAPEPEQTLRSFYQRTNPGGAWGRFTEGMPKDQAVFGLWAIGNWLCGLALVYGATFAVGFAIFARWLPCLVSAAIGVAGSGFLYARLGRITSWTPPEVPDR